MKGWVYIISNPAMPGLLKVGFSTKDPAMRAQELNHTGSPYPYRVEYEVLVENPRDVEQMVHIRLGQFHEAKEWFRCTHLDAVKSIRAVVGSARLLENIFSDAVVQGDYAACAGSDNVEVRKLVATNPLCPENILIELAGDNERDIWLCIAENPSTPSAALERLIEVIAFDVESNEHIFLTLLQHPECTSRVLDTAYDLIGCIEEGLLPDIAESLACSPELIVKMLWHFEPDSPEYSSLKRHPAYSDGAYHNSQYLHLAEGDYGDRWLLASRSDCQGDFLTQLSTDTDEGVRQEVARNPKCSETVLEHLAADSSDSVRKILVARDDLPPNILTILAGDINVNVRYAVAEHKSCDSATVLRLAKFDPSSSVRGAAYSNPKLEPSLLLHGAEFDPDQDVRDAASANRNCIIFQIHPDQNPSAEFLNQSAGIKSTLLRTLIARNPRCYSDTFHRLANDENAGVRNAVASNQACPGYLFSHFVDDPVGDVRLSAARNPACPEMVLEKFSNSLFYEYRKAVAENPKLPINIRTKLMNDSNADVRNTARHRTNKIRDPDSKNTFKSKETLEILREKFRLHVHKNLGALIAEDELIRLANLPQEDKVNFADKFPMHAKQLALFEKYVFPQLKLSSQGQSSVYSENTEAPCCGYSGEQNERS